MKAKVLVVLLALQLYSFTALQLYSLDLGFAKEDGGRPGGFLSFGAGARSLALGKTFVGIADDASTIYWNPAGLATLPKPEIMALYASMYEQTGYSFAAGVIPLKLATSDQRLGTVGLALVNLSSRGFQLRDEYNYELGEGGVSETAAILSYGTKVPFAVGGQQLGVGANLKIVNQNIDTKSDTGYGMDIGFLWKQYLNPMSIGLSVQNLVAPKLTLIEDTDKYPLSTTLGCSYRFFDRKLLTAIDLNKTENRQVKLHVGAEYTFVKMLALRVGLDETEVTSGLGFTWQNYSLDYAFAYHDAWKGYEDLGISHRFGLTMRWGNVKTDDKMISVYVDKEKQEEIMSAAAPVIEPALSEEKLKQEIKEQIEKETGQKVSNIEIEKIEEVEHENIASSMIKEKPQTTNSKQLTYEVKPGDCLWDIAGKPEICGNSWNWVLIYEANKKQVKDPAVIYPGQILEIPLKH